MSRPRLPHGAIGVPALAFALFVCACAPVDPPARSAPPSVLILVADDLAQRALGVHGGPAGLTPHLDRLAAESVVFEHATASSPFCTPSRQSFLTGRWPHAIGVTQVSSLLPAGVTTLGDVFRGAGYRTAAFGKMHWQRRRSRGLDRGFDAIADVEEWREHLSPGDREAYEAYRDLWRERGEVGWSHLNLFGGAHAFSVETQFSSREQRFQVGIREPRLPKIDLPAYLVVYRTYEEFATYAQRRRGLWIDVGDRYKRPYRSWWRYEYQIVQPEDVSGEIGREEEEARISSITPTFEWDYRDNPLVPSRGSYSEVAVDYAFPLFQADSEFLKLRARTTLYGDIANGRGAIGVRLGAIRPLGPGDDQPANLQIPLNTRFFAGGANTHRAFARDFLGVPGQTIDTDGNPIGGNALVLVNAEYVRKLTAMFSAHLFVDAGNVWESPSTVRFGDVRWGAGLGFSFDTPAGPIRLEYGWKLDRKDGESPGQWWLSFGIPF